MLPSGFQLILSLLFINLSAFPPSVIFVDMRDATAEKRQTSNQNSNKLCNLCSLGGCVAVVERVHLGPCSAESLYKGTECQMRYYCVPVRKRCSFWEAMSAKILITTLITAPLFHDIAFQAKGTQSLLHVVLCIFYTSSISAAHVLVPIDCKVT